MIKVIKFGTPLCFNPNRGTVKSWDNCFNGTFSYKKPISIMINNSKIIRGDSCHSLWNLPETVLWIKKDGTHGTNRVQTVTQIKGYRDIVFAIGGVGISNYNPELEGFCKFIRVNNYTRKLETKNFSDVLRKTNHSVFGFKDNVFFASIMFGIPEEIQAECLKIGLTDVVMCDGGAWASCNTKEFKLNLDKAQYSLVQLYDLVDVELKRSNEMINIVLDAGHGPNTAGKRTPLFKDGTFMHEHDFNNAVVNKLERKLSIVDEFDVTIVSSGTEDISLSERVNIEKSIKSDLFLSVHANALTGKWGSRNGIESYSNPGSNKGAEYCKVFQKGLIDSTGLNSRGCKTSSFYVLKNTIGPAVLVECGFMDNKKEAKLLMSDEYRETVAESLFKSICSIFNIVLIETVEEKVKIDYKALYEEAQLKLDKIKEIM